MKNCKRNPKSWNENNPNLALIWVTLKLGSQPFWSYLMLGFVLKTLKILIFEYFSVSNRKYISSVHVVLVLRWRFINTNVDFALCKTDVMIFFVIKTWKIVLMGNYASPTFVISLLEFLEDPGN